MPDDEDNEEIMTHAFGGMINHSEKYKQYQDLLKRGMPSGISGVFGKPADLLPSEHLEEYVRGQTGYEPGESLIADGVDPALLRQAVEGVILQFHQHAGVDFNSPELEEVEGREVVGMFFDGNQMKYMYSDGTIEVAPEISSSPGESEGEEAAGAFRELAAALLDVQLDSQMEEISADTPDGAQEEEPQVESLTESLSREDIVPSVQQQNFVEPEITTTPAISPVAGLFSQEKTESASAAPMEECSNEQTLEHPQESPSAHVTGRDGSWLWDVYTTGGKVSQVVMADGTTIQEVENGTYVVISPPRAGERVPQLEFAQMVTCDRQTGNIYYSSTNNSHAVAIVNSGWRIDQYKKAGGGEEYFVTEPLRPDQPAGRKTQVLNMRMDSETSDIYYESMDGGTFVTLKSRRLFP